MLHDSSIVKKKGTLLYKSLGVFLFFDWIEVQQPLPSFPIAVYPQGHQGKWWEHFSSREKTGGKMSSGTAVVWFLAVFQSGDEKTPEKNWWRIWRKPLMIGLDCFIWVQCLILLGFLKLSSVSTKNNKNCNENENKNNIIDMNTMKGNTI